MFASDAATFLADFGVPVVWASSPATPKPTGLMVFDQPAVDLQSGEVMSSDYQVTLEVASWPNLKRDDRLTIGGADYVLRSKPHVGDDGVFAKATLSKV